MFLLLFIIGLAMVFSSFRTRTVPNTVKFARYVNRFQTTMNTITLENVKNIRDLQTACPRINIMKSKVFRTGCISKASLTDVRHSF